MPTKYSCIIKVVSYNSNKIQTAFALIKSLSHNYILESNSILLPTQRKVYTVLRSPHIDKKSREQFEFRTHSGLIKIFSKENDTLINLIDQIKRTITPGVSLKIKFYNHEII